MMTKTKDQEMVDEFKRRFNRDPTSEDIDRISRHVVSQLDKRELKSEGEREQRLSFSSMIEGIHGIGLPVSVKDVYSAMDALSNEERASLAEERTRSEQRKRTRTRYIKGLVLASFLGIAGGAGIAAYNATYDPLVKNSVSEYESRKAELEKRFFGPLPSLQTHYASALTPHGREILVQGGLLNPDISSADIFYETVMGNVKIQAKQLDLNANSNMCNAKYLFLIKRDAGDNGILEVHTYTGYNNARCGNITDLVNNSEPFNSLIFQGKGWRLINYPKGNNQGHIEQTTNGRTQIFEGGNISPYTEAAREVLEDFSALYSRGPGQIK